MRDIELIQGRFYYKVDRKSQIHASLAKRLVPLLPCPFCGTAPDVMVLAGFGQFTITCENNECKTDDVWTTGATAKEVVDNWNTRVGMVISELDRPDLFAEILSALGMLARCGDMQQQKAKETVKAVDMLKMHMGFQDKTKH